MGAQLVTGAAMDAWQRLLRAHFVIARQLDAELQEAHGLTLSDYDVMVQLRDAEECSLRMSELSRRTMLTRSGMTRLVQGLMAGGLVERQACEQDARVSYAILTPAGHERLAEARVTHHAGIRRVFADHFSEDEAAALAGLLAQIPGASPGEDTCCDAADGRVPD